MAEGAPYIARQHMHACARGGFASATRIRIGGLRVSIPSSHVPGRAVAWTCRLTMTLLAPLISKRRKDRLPVTRQAPDGECKHSTDGQRIAQQSAERAFRSTPQRPDVLLTRMHGE